MEKKERDESEGLKVLIRKEERKEESPGETSEKKGREISNEPITMVCKSSLGELEKGGGSAHT